MHRITRIFWESAKYVLILGIKLRAHNHRPNVRNSKWKSMYTVIPKLKENESIRGRRKRIQGKKIIIEKKERNNEKNEKMGLFPGVDIETL